MSEQRDLGRISLGVNTKVFVLGLPSKTESVIVKYDTGDDEEWEEDEIAFRVSCVVPPAKHLITTEDDYCEYKDLKVTTPYQIICIDYCDIPIYKKAQAVVCSHWHFALNMAFKNKIRIKPYLMANTFPNGEICFGDYMLPVDLKQTYTQFWSSTFNDELCNSLSDARAGKKFTRKVKLPTSQDKKITSYYGKILPAQKWEEGDDFICGKSYWASPEGAAGIIITNQKALLRKIDRKFWRKSVQGTFIIVKANPIASGDWLCESGGFKFVLDGRNISLHHKPRKLSKKIKKLMATNHA